MNRDDDSLLRNLKRVTRGLTFMSESDYPVEPFLQDGAGQPAPTAQDFVASKKTDANAGVSEVDFDNFFKGATQEQDGQDSEARTQAARFQSLVRLLRDNLSDIHVYRVGDVEADVYVTGRTKSGSLAGVTTKVVET
ncbi:MAG TPA: nuclease A inhibitor family protein [Pyrinomonadaceae bacterium]|nr:nuclease A inhibitor family protein [Pyrinomonadaceae bacterium]